MSVSCCHEEVANPPWLGPLTSYIQTLPLKGVHTLGYGHRQTVIEFKYHPGDIVDTTRRPPSTCVFPSIIQFSLIFLLPLAIFFSLPSTQPLHCTERNLSIIQHRKRQISYMNKWVEAACHAVIVFPVHKRSHTISMQIVFSDRHCLLIPSLEL